MPLDGCSGCILWSRDFIGGFVRFLCSVVCNGYCDARVMTSGIGVVLCVIAVKLLVSSGYWVIIVFRA